MVCLLSGTHSLTEAEEGILHANRANTDSDNIRIPAAWFCLFL